MKRGVHMKKLLMQTGEIKGVHNIRVLSGLILLSTTICILLCLIVWLSMWQSRNEMMAFEEVQVVDEKIMESHDVVMLGSRFLEEHAYDQFKVTQGLLIQSKNETYWLLPLEHNHYWSYLTNKSLPGYIKIHDATGTITFIDKQIKSSNMMTLLSEWVILNGRL